MIFYIYAHKAAAKNKQKNTQKYLTAEQEIDNKISLNIMIKDRKMYLTIHHYFCVARVSNIFYAE